MTDFYIQAPENQALTLDFSEVNNVFDTVLGCPHWTAVTEDGTAIELTNATVLPAGKKVYFYGEDTPSFASDDGAVQATPKWFKITNDSIAKVMTIGGNIMSLMNGHNTNDDTPKTHDLYGYPYTDVFAGAFQEASIIFANDFRLPTTLWAGCFRKMFQDATIRGADHLTNLLPATTLAKNCYLNMFSGAMFLKTEVPGYAFASINLPATTLVENCYGSMFSDAKYIRYIKVGFTEWPENGETTNWVKGAEESNTCIFIGPKDLPDLRDKDHIPVGWSFGHHFNGHGSVYIGNVRVTTR